MTEHPRLAEAGWGQTLRAMDYLAYAYLPGGQDREAKRVLDQFLTSRKRELESLANVVSDDAIGEGRQQRSSCRTCPRSPARILRSLSRSLSFS